MKNIILTGIALISVGMINIASANNEVYSMLGKWSWEGFVIEVNKCEATEVCATVISGPKNVGLEMIQSKLKTTDGQFFGKIAHPQTGATYNSKLSMTNDSTWHIDGCTDKNVCASGDFTRIN